MFIIRRRGVVAIWFVFWGQKGTVFNADLYMTAAGLKEGITKGPGKDVPIVRLGKIECTENGPVEKIYWVTREAFLSQYQYLYPKKTSV
jgi:hypothetical protein